MSTKELDADNIPNHIAIIMDGNGRWAKAKGLPRIAGHKEGINSVRDITRICGEIGVNYLTLYTFSTENWNRPKKEVNALMSLLLSTIKKEVRELHKNNVKFSTIGHLSFLPKNTENGLKEGMDLTKNNTGLNLILALNYGSRQEIIDSVINIANKVKSGEIDSNHIDETLFSSFLYTKNYPDPDLLIRTGNTKRLSNFLLWQMSYAEFWVTSDLWPDFTENHLDQALAAFRSRERRFGGLSSS